MRHALTSPVLGSIALGAIALTLGALHATLDEAPVTRRLVLYAEQRPDAIYLTAFERGERIMTFDRAELRPITFEIRAVLYDGCSWLGTETLVPLDESTYSYEYEETILECLPGAVPLFKTPRTGLVTVERY